MMRVMPMMSMRVMRVENPERRKRKRCMAWYAVVVFVLLVWFVGTTLLLYQLTRAFQMQVQWSTWNRSHLLINEDSVLGVLFCPSLSFLFFWFGWVSSSFVLLRVAVGWVFFCLFYSIARYPLRPETVSEMKHRD